MNDRLAAQGIRIRDVRWEDIPAIVALRSRTQPDEPRTIEIEEYREKTYPPDNPRLRYAVENAAGEFIGMGGCVRPFWMKAPGVYHMWITVDPDWRRRGIGQALLPRFETYGREQGADKLWTGCREDQDYSIRFLEKAEFHTYGLRFESMLDLTTFDEGRFAGTLERLQAAGFEFTNLIAERAINPEADRQLYELDAETGSEVPWPGGARFETTYEQFRQRHIDGPEADLAGILIAKYQGQFAGLTMVEFGKDKPAHTAMTGVRRAYRGQGLALALKLLSFRLMKEHGCTQTITQNDTANPPILRLNEKLGYQKRPGLLQWEKML
jgi:ribosomal protein S18 acetylase RimI-like enzyme